MYTYELIYSLIFADLRSVQSVTSEVLLVTTCRIYAIPSCVGGGCRVSPVVEAVMDN